MVVTVMCLSVVACGSSSKANGTLSTLSTVAPPPSTSTIANEATTVPGTLTTFFYTAFIDSVDLHAHTITIDPMAFLTGAAAKTAFKHDHPTAKEGPPNDYYIVNPTRQYLRFPFSPTAVVRLVSVNGVPHTNPVKVAETSLAGYGSLKSRPFRITGENGAVTSVVEIFVP